MMKEVKNSEDKNPKKKKQLKKITISPAGMKTPVENEH